MSSESASTPRRPRWSLKRRVAVGAACVVVVLAGGPLLLFAGLDHGLFDGPIQKIASAKAGRAVHFGRLRTRLLSAQPSFVIDDLVIGSPPSVTPDDLLHTPRLSARVRLAPLLAGRLDMSELTIERPELRLIRLDSARNNYSFGGGGSGSALRSVEGLAVTDGRVWFKDTDRQGTLIGTFAHDGRRGAARALTLTGTGILRGEPYTLQARGGPLNARVPGAAYPFDADLVDGAVRLRLSGVSDKPFDFHAFDFRAQASGPNLADFRHLFGALVPNSPTFRLSARIQRKEHAFRLSALDAVIGGSDVKGELFTDHPPGRRRIVRATFTSHVLRLADVRALLAPIPPHAATRRTPGVAQPHARDTGGRLFSDKSLNLAPLRRTDVDLTVRARAVPDGPLAVSDLSTRLKLTGGDLRFEPLAFRTGSGRVSASLRLDAARATPDASVRGSLTGVRLTALKPGLSRTADADLDLWVDLRGHGVSAHAVAASTSGRVAVRLSRGRLPRAKAAVLGGDLLQAVGLSLGGGGGGSATLSCGVAEFDAAGGKLQSRRLEAVSDIGTTRGRGAVDLGAERLAFTLNGEAAGRRLVRASAPVQVEGPLVRPHVSVDRGKAIKAAGLAILAAPLQAVLPGLGRAAPTPDCTALMRDAAAFTSARR